jgi:hypothetical protein
MEEKNENENLCSIDNMFDISFSNFLNEKEVMTLIENLIIDLITTINKNERLFFNLKFRHNFMIVLRNKKNRKMIDNTFYLGNMKKKKKIFSKGYKQSSFFF